MEQSPTLIKTHHVTVDVDIKNESVGAIKQNNVNSIKFIIHITDNGQPFNIDPVAEAAITIKRPDGTLSNSILSEAGNTYEYLCEPNAINMPGIYEAEVQLYGNENNLLLTSSFFYQVVTSLANDEGITEQAEYPLLVQLIADVEGMEQTLETLQTTITSAESSRVGAESLRVTSESARVSAEVIRVNNENVREQQESDRIQLADELGLYMQLLADITFIGTYANGVNYKKGNSVSFLGRVYYCVSNCINILPTSTSHWRLMFSGVIETVELLTWTANTTLATANGGKYIRVNSSSGVTITVPSNTFDPIPIGTIINFTRVGTGSVVFNPAPTVTINSRDGGLAIDGQYGSATLIKVATNTWDLLGAV